MRLVPIPDKVYEEYRQQLMFECYKWDPQFVDNNTVAKYALVLTKEEAIQIARDTELLARETIEAEEFLNQNLDSAKVLRLPKRLKKEIASMKNYNRDKNVRLMRFDFHPIRVSGEGEGSFNYAVSEVNSDVPGGHAEGSIMPFFAKEVLENYGGTDKYMYKDLSSALTKAIAKKVPENGTIFLNHCTCYSDDRQVMEFDSDRLRACGFNVIIGAADHIRFRDNKAYSILDGNECELDGIFRYTPVEWLLDIKPRKWQGYFNTHAVACNHPVSLFAQTKRFPFVWDELEKHGISMANWRRLLPETAEVDKDIMHNDEFIFKPAYGRVGERISIKEACKGDEYNKILKDVKRHPKRYIAQKRFDSMTVPGVNGEEYHVCIGSYAVEGKHASFYARISDLPRIDSNAADIPVLILDEDNISKEEALDNGFITSPSAISEDKPYLCRVNNPALSRYAYSQWADASGKWSPWVRPVPFINIGVGRKGFDGPYSLVDYFDGDDKEVKLLTKNTAIIIDVSGDQSVMAALSLAKNGYRPVPLYNGTMEQDGARAISDNKSVSEALLWGIEILKDMSFEENAMPVFLLDSNRLNRHKGKRTLFDNSWDIYAQDMPSAKFLSDNGVEKIVVISEKISRDLKDILFKYQKGNLDIYLKKIYEQPRKIKIRKFKGKR